jgi:hypothetical protein
MRRCLEAGAVALEEIRQPRSRLRFAARAREQACILEQESGATLGLRVRPTYVPVSCVDEGCEVLRKRSLWLDDSIVPVALCRASLVGEAALHAEHDLLRRRGRKGIICPCVAHDRERLDRLVQATRESVRLPERKPEIVLIGGVEVQTGPVDGGGL